MTTANLQERLWQAEALRANTLGKFLGVVEIFTEDCGFDSEMACARMVEIMLEYTIRMGEINADTE